jgi:hypothetical protein
MVIEDIPRSTPKGRHAHPNEDMLAHPLKIQCDKWTWHGFDSPVSGSIAEL